jgi:hypothetical protein
VTYSNSGPYPTTYEQLRVPVPGEIVLAERFVANQSGELAAKENDNA